MKTAKILSVLTVFLLILSLAACGTDKDGKYVVTVTNFSPLPETGGNGTLLFVMLGVLMLALGTAWYLRANRMEPAAAGGAGAGTALPVGRKRGRHTR